MIQSDISAELIQRAKASFQQMKLKRGLSVILLSSVRLASVATGLLAC